MDCNSRGAVVIGQLPPALSKIRGNGLFFPGQVLGHTEKSPFEGFWQCAVLRPEPGDPRPVR